MLNKKAKEILKAIRKDADRRRSYYIISRTWWPFGGGEQRLAYDLGCDDELWKDVYKLHQRHSRLIHYIKEIDPQWRDVKPIYYADNSVEMVQENKHGERRQIMLEAPHGDACF